MARPPKTNLPAMPIEEIASSIFEEFILKMQSNPEMLVGAFPVGSALVTMMSVVKARFDQGPKKWMDTVTDEAFRKADIIFDFHQDVIRQIGSQTDAFHNLDRIQQGVYDTAMLYEGTLAGTEEHYIRFFESEEQMLKEFNGIINNNLLLTHFAGNASQEQVAELPLLARALGYKTDMMQTFMNRQFARTGEANDSLLRSTLAHALAAENATGISSKIITEHVGEMMSEVSLFGDMTEDQMTRAAVEVAQLGLEMSTVTSMVRGFNDFESAAGNVAKLTQALGIQVDVMDAVALANESPDQLMQMFRQQFDIAGIDVHSLSMPMKRALADIFGAKDTQEVEQMFGNASHGLSEFLALADEGLAKVGDPEVDEALAMASSNLERRRILRGDAAAMGAEAAARIDAALSTALATTMNNQKENMDRETERLLATQGDMIKDGVLEPLIKNIEDSSAEIFIHLGTMMDQITEKLRQFGVDTKQGIPVSEALEEMLDMVPPTQAELAAKAARTRAAKTNIQAVDRTAAAADDDPGTAHNLNYEFRNREAFNELLTYLGPRLTDETKQAEMFTALRNLLTDDKAFNNTVNLEFTNDTLVWTLPDGTEHTQPVVFTPRP